MTTTYIVYNLQGYDTYDKDKDQFIGVISISVIAKSETEAIAKAKKHHTSKTKFRVVGSTEYQDKN